MLTRTPLATTPAHRDGENRATLLAGSAQAGFITWLGTSLAVDMLLPVGCDYQPNWMHFCDPRIDKRIARLGREEPTDPAGTAGRAAAIDREITNRAPWVPLITPRFVDLTSARVGNY